jgi:hypothetical protein
MKIWRTGVMLMATMWRGVDKKNKALGGSDRLELCQ